MPCEFHYRRRVHFQDTDTAGIIHFSNYFRYMEEAETEFTFHLAKLAGIEAPAEFFATPRVAVSAEFMRPVRFGDILDVHIRCVHKGRTSVGYKLRFEHEGQEVARGDVRCVFVEKTADGGMKPMPIPEALDRLLEAAPES